MSNTIRIDSKLAIKYLNQVKMISWKQKRYNDDLKYLKWLEKTQKEDKVNLKDVIPSYRFRVTKLKREINLLQRGLSVLTGDYKGNSPYEIPPLASYISTR